MKIQQHFALKRLRKAARPLTETPCSLPGQVHHVYYRAIIQKTALLLPLPEVRAMFLSPAASARLATQRARRAEPSRATERRRSTSRNKTSGHFTHASQSDTALSTHQIKVPPFRGAWGTPVNTRVRAKGRSWQYRSSASRLSPPSSAGLRGGALLRPSSGQQSPESQIPKTWLLKTRASTIQDD
ncbi:hypothetical protein AOLI_G00133180 [Acnodon oligacanthus]